jgi:FtsP/CotA-like multicopper oxidase with cupredoxin domain
MTTGLGPYVGVDATSTNPTPGPLAELETTFVASKVTVNIGNGVTANVEVFNGAIPGPTLRLNVNDRVVIRLINDLDYPIGIHWHGVELENYSDGTEIVQNGVTGGSFQNIPMAGPSGGTFLYKFRVPRAGLFWYHPHHGSSINRLFRGLYGLIVVTDPLELSLRAPGAAPHGTLPAITDTMQLVLSDITVGKGVGSTDPTYVASYIDPTTIPTVADRPEWLSGATSQNGPTPRSLCELPPTYSATWDDGTAGNLPRPPAISPSFPHLPTASATSQALL